MDKLLFEIQEKKNITVGMKKTFDISRESIANMGAMLESVLGSEKPMIAKLRGGQEIELQKLKEFVTNQTQLKITQPFQDPAEDMIALINKAKDLSGDPDIAAQEDLMNNKFLKQIFGLNETSINSETGLLNSVPSLVDRDSFDDILSSINQKSKQIDAQFVEDFIAYGSGSSGTDVVTNRIRAAGKLSGKSIKDIDQEVTERLTLITNVKERYASSQRAANADYAVIRELIESSKADLVDSEQKPLSDVVDDLMNKFRRESAADEAAAVASEQDITNRISGSLTDNTGSGKYTRIQDYLKSAKMKEVYEGLLKNKTKIAGVAAIGTGLAIFGSIRNKERTQESLSGPPLLPGGNPYERIPNTPMNLSEAPTAQSNQGMSYNVSVNGDQDKIQEFMTRARTSNKRSNARYYA